MIFEAISPTVEGSLDIRWTNSDDGTATPLYNLFFLRYENFKNGAQQPYAIVGISALEGYLAELGFAEDNLKDWIKQAHADNYVSIPNVMLPERHLVDYGLVR
jgi:hypothetical protein